MTLSDSDLLSSGHLLVVIVTYNNESETCALLNHLIPSSAHPLARRTHFVIWDNASAKKFQAPTVDFSLEVIHAEKNLGYGGGIAAAILHATHSSSYAGYLVLNSDLLIDWPSIESLWFSLWASPQRAAVGPRVLKPNGSPWGSVGRVDPDWGLTRMLDTQHSLTLPQWSYLPGCSILFRSDAYFKAGGFPTDYFLYFEETELCIRLQKLGYELYVNAAATAHHSVQSLDHGIPSASFSYYFIRNNVLFWARNFETPRWLQAIRSFGVLIKEIWIPLFRRARGEILRDRLILSTRGWVDGWSFNGKN